MENKNAQAIGYQHSKTDRILLEQGCDLHEECRSIVRQAEFNPAFPVLDVGTGSGRMLSVLLENGFSVISGDSDVQALKSVMEKYADYPTGMAAYTVMDAENMKFTDDFFENIICANALHEFANPMKALEQMKRVCASSGKLVVSDFHDEGFVQLEQAFRVSHGTEHTKTDYSRDDVTSWFNGSFRLVRCIRQPMFDIWIGCGKV